MKLLCFYTIILFSVLGYSQTDNDFTDKSELYKNYREDQFYVSVTYNLLNLKHKNVNKN